MGRVTRDPKPIPSQPETKFEDNSEIPYRDPTRLFSQSGP